MTTISATSILASCHAVTDDRLDTLLLRYPRCIHSEFMTHRHFCLAGDARLDFELPGRATTGTRRVHSMTVKEFVEKWENGAAKHRSARHNGAYLSLPTRDSYTAREVAAALGFKNALNLNDACRKGLIPDAEKLDGQWIASAEAWEQWRNRTGFRRFSINKRLAAMSIRQIDENTGRVRLSSVKAVQRSGVKPVFQIKTLNYEVAGSADHLIFTERGWVRIGDIIIGQDRVATYKYGTGLKEDPFRNIDGKWVSRWNLSVRDEVANRQSHRCAETGEPLEPNFHIHHVQPRHKRPDLAFDIDNVVAVNAEAHRALHGIQGWQEGVPLQSGFEVVEAIGLRGEEETFDLEIAGEFPNFFANGVVVHNSRNAASSRAIPVEKLIQDVLDDPFVPLHWGKNQKGMQAREECNEPVLDHVAQREQDLISREFPNFSDPEGKWYPCKVDREKAWLRARDNAVEMARAFSEAGYHKQIVNRLLEPFSHITVVCSSTNWSNFLALRDHPDAEPHIQMLAREIRKALDGADVQELQPGEWHLPFVTNEDWNCFPQDIVVGGDGYSYDEAVEVLRKVSAARCASTSYKTVDGFDMTIERAVVLVDKLIGSTPLHASPFEHVAQADVVERAGLFGTYKNRHQHGNFTGFSQWRKMLPGECQ